MSVLVAPELVYVPGDWVCPKCGFVQSMRTLHADSGAVGTSPEVPLPCPNDGQYMERLTWKQHAQNATEVATMALEGERLAKKQAEDMGRTLALVLLSAGTTLVPDSLVATYEAGHLTLVKWRDPAADGEYWMVAVPM